jgi:hypothetical protein
LYDASRGEVDFQGKTMVVDATRKPAIDHQAKASGALIRVKE